MAKAARGRASETKGRVWIWVEESITSSKLTVVDELIDATILQRADAEQITRKANQEYSKYLWQPVPATRTDEFVVRGESRAHTL
jgi:hypothetical protein